jgi:hypothetical protein
VQYFLGAGHGAQGMGNALSGKHLRPFCIAKNLAKYLFSLSLASWRLGGLFIFKSQVKREKPGFSKNRVCAIGVSYRLTLSPPK